MVSPIHMPSKYQKSLWANWYQEDLGTDPQGRWLGWCPLHDPERATEASATYNFSVGSMTCLAASKCHKGNSISLDRVIAAIASRFLNAEPLSLTTETKPFDRSAWSDNGQ